MSNPDTNDPNAPQPADSTTKDNPGVGPVGKGDHIVEEGDCLFSIAYEAGFNWETLWNLSDNSDLKTARESPNHLLPGDRLTVPPITVKQVSKADGQQYTFKLKNVPAQRVLRIMMPPDLSKQTEKEATDDEDSDDALHVKGQDPDAPDAQEDKPWANVPYRVEIDGTSTTGKANSDGKITINIAPNARTGTLYLNPDNQVDGGSRTITLSLGGLAPSGELMGIKQRLLHLGFDCGDTDNDVQSDDFAEAIAAFREMHAMEAGGLDQELIDKIKEEHGS